MLVNGTNANLPRILAGHLDAVTSIENFNPMSKPNITIIDLKTQMKKTKEKAASGLDGMKPDLLKIIGEDEYCLRVMVKGMNKILNKVNKEDNMPNSWLQSKTVMIPKKKKPTVRDVHGNTEIKIRKTHQRHWPRQ